MEPCEFVPMERLTEVRGIRYCVAHNALAAECERDRLAAMVEAWHLLAAEVKPDILAAAGFLDEVAAERDRAVAAVIALKAERDEARADLCTEAEMHGKKVRFSNVDCGVIGQCRDGDNNFPNVGLPCRRHALGNASKWRDFAKGFQEERDAASEDARQYQERLQRVVDGTTKIREDRDRAVAAVIALKAERDEARADVVRLRQDLAFERSRWAGIGPKRGMDDGGTPG
jgi:hypothetical protein